tara:strand:- start:52 stop:690 length:639 start_codon:yes stop_codon:yes gene_type:complete
MKTKSSTNQIPLAIGISGGSGSGKSMIAEKLKNEYGEKLATVINQDAYYKDLSHMPFDERCNQNFDHPDAIDFDLFIFHVKQLKNKQKIDLPIYDFSEHLRSKEIISIQPQPIIIIDGTLIFTHSELNQIINLKIFINIPDDQRFAYRMQRDTKERGRTVKSVTKQYNKSVRPMYDEFIYPSKKYADLIIDNKKDYAQSIASIKNEINKILI